MSDIIKDIRRAIYYYLARRDYSIHELKQKLKQKKFPSAETNSVIDEFTASNLINENRFVEAFVNSRRNKGYGPLRILQELKMHKIDEVVIAEHLRITDNVWFVEAQKVWKKHFKNKLPNDFKTKAKHMRFMLYRGFDKQHIETIFATSEM